jgi:nucleotidyltransferase/DNA polymerase involved in DNA repair
VRPAGDRALGGLAEPITSPDHPLVPMVECRLLEPVGTAEAIAQVMEDLLRELAEVLQARGTGARSLRFIGMRVDGTEQVVGIGKSRPTRQVPHLLRLLELRMERIDPAIGIEQCVLVAPHTQPLNAIDLGAVLAGDVAVRDPARLVDVVAGRICERAVFRIAPVPSHVPERAVTRTSPIAVPGDWPSWPRPVRLFARPEPLRGVIALMPDQPPRRFEWRGRPHRVVAADGPERIHGE